jgi:hypothetical protein
MGKRVDIVGQRFSRLVVLSMSEKTDKNFSRFWLCQCDCGNMTTLRTADLCSKSRGTKSCGCLVKENGAHKRTHGKTRTHASAYNSWSSMIDRCYSPKNKNFHHYGGRGIFVCERWMQFEYFLEDMGDPPGHGYSIDRKDNENGSYCIENCRWVTARVQNRNRRDNIYLEFNGKRQLVIEWAEELGIKFTTLYHRIVKCGWDVERALTTPLRSWSRGNPFSVMKAFDKEKSVDVWAKEYNINPSTLRNRLLRGISPENALLMPVRTSRH